MLGLHKDLTNYFVERLDDRTLFTICQLDKEHSRICEDPIFWEKRSKNRLFPQYIKQYQKFIDEKGWKKFYIGSIYIRWERLIFNIFKNTFIDKKISKKAVEFLIEIFEPFYEKLNNIPIQNFREKLRNIIGEELEKHAFSRLVDTDNSHDYYKAIYDKRRIIEFLLSEVIELSGMDEKKMLTDKNIIGFLRTSDEFRFLIV